MDDREITVVARAYAEEIVQDTDSYPELPICLLNEMRKEVAEDFEEKIRFLLRRFCLVEKEKVREAYKDAQKDQHNSERDFALTLAGRNRSSVLIDLFPEIAKEVEG